MKSKVKSTALLLTGAVLGASLTTPAARAVAEFAQAQRTPHPIYVDGQQVQMETYAIGGHNYVKLRDIGQAVGFEVYWDGSAVQGRLHLRWNDKEGLKRGEQEEQQLNAVLAALGPYPSYELVSSEDGYLCQVRYSEVDAPAAEHTKDFINSLDGLSDREKIKRISWYVCDRIAYDKTCYVWPHEALAQDDELRGACMSFAYSFQFLCSQAGIPCVFKHGGNHQWNTVYAEGRWWDVDVSGDNIDAVDYYENGVTTGNRAFDGTDDFREQFYVTADRVLRESDPFPDERPEITRCAQEVLVPGSTR